MAISASSLINKVNSILTSTDAIDRTVYGRITSDPDPSTNDVLTGRYSSGPVVVDTLLSPQPFYQRIGRQHVPGGHAEAVEMLVGSADILADDYMFLFSSSSVTRAQLENPDFSIVLYDSNGDKEQLRMLDPTPIAYQGTDVVYECYFRSVVRPASQ